MKQYLFLIALIAVPLGVYAQNKTYYGYVAPSPKPKKVQKLSFECGGYSFVIYSDETPLEFSFKVGDDIRYDYEGRVKAIGDISVSYEYKKRVSYIGNVRIDYNYEGFIKSIGGMDIEYDYEDRLKGTRGEIGCRW